MKRILRPFFTVSLWTLISRLLGYLRDFVIASKMGVSDLTDVFFLAFRLPNFFRRLFAEGALNPVFVPMYTELAKDKEEAKKFAIKIFWIICFVLLLIVTVFDIFMPLVYMGLTPGIIGTTKFQLAVELTRITFPYLLFICLCSLISGILNSYGRFFAFAFAPCIINVVLILSVLYWPAETKAHSLAYGVLLSGILQFIFMINALRRLKIFTLHDFFKYKISLKDSRVSVFFKKFIPASIASSVTQINFLFDNIVSSFIPHGITYLYFADRVMQFPLALIGTALGVASLPFVSRYVYRNKNSIVIKSQNELVLYGLLFSIPSMLGFIFLGHEIITALFERGEFTAENSLNVYYALIAFSLGLPAYVSVKILTNFFFAKGDTKTPLKIALKVIIINLVLNIALVLYFKHINLPPHAGIPLASSIASWINFLLIRHHLKKAGLYALHKRFFTGLIVIFFAAFAMALALFYGKEYRLFSSVSVDMLAKITISGIIYFAVIFSHDVFSVRKLLQRKARKKRV